MNFWPCWYILQCQLNCFVLSGVQASDPARFQGLMQTLDFHYQALASGVAEYADKRRVEIEKEKLEKANNAHKSNSSSVPSISIWVNTGYCYVDPSICILSVTGFMIGWCDLEVSRKYYKIVCNFPFSQERCRDIRSIKGGCFYYLLLWFVIIIVALFIYCRHFFLLFLFSGLINFNFLYYLSLGWIF